MTDATSGRAVGVAVGPAAGVDDRSSLQGTGPRGGASASVSEVPGQSGEIDAVEQPASSAGKPLVELPFSAAGATVARAEGGRLVNWPVVYVLHGPGHVYVGETRNFATRLRQHVEAGTKRGVRQARVVIDPEYNKSACLDLESRLVRLFAGDGKLTVLNGNAGITDADYFDRERYQASFDDVFQSLREQGLFERTVAEIENSDLFKLSPFKALSQDQAIAIEDLIEGLVEDLGTGATSTMVVEGVAGTGKTVVGIYLIKLLRDIAAGRASVDDDSDSMFAEYFADDVRKLLEPLRIGLVVPQQSLRTSVRSVFRKVPGLDPAMVLSPFEIGGAKRSTDGSVPFDLLIIDEAHRLSQRANQASGRLNLRFAEINESLFGRDSDGFTQLDWVRAQSTHQIYLLDTKQRVRPADLPEETLDGLLSAAVSEHRRYRLTSQMRVRAGEDYVGLVRTMLSDEPSPARPASYEEYDLRLFDDFAAMRQEIRELDARHGLARLVAGFAWPWHSKKHKGAPDIVVDGVGMQWNRTDTDWIASPTAIDEVGSIHTVQGYDLNYAGVIIGGDLRWDDVLGRARFDRGNYFDRKGMENNRRLGITYTDENLLALVRNIYAVLLTRGMRGTLIYVVDEPLRERLRCFISTG